MSRECSRAEVQNARSQERLELPRESDSFPNITFECVIQFTSYSARNTHLKIMSALFPIKDTV